MTSVGMLPAAMGKRRQTGVRRVHSPACPTRDDRDARCRCKAGWEASVYDLSGRKVRRTFPAYDEAVAWRADSLVARRRGGFRAPTPTTVREAGERLVEGMKSGAVRTRSGDRYKPSVVRSYEQSLRLHIYPDLGGLRLAAVRRQHVQAIADGMLDDGRDPSTIRNALMPLRVVFRRAVEDGEVAASPCASLRLPAVRGRRERIASPEEAAELLAALDGCRDRAVWATAFYAGLRLGELRGLRWPDVDLAQGVIRVERALDHTGAVIAPKSRAGRRTVPIVAALRDVLLDLRLDRGEPADGYVFGHGEEPVAASTVYDRARTAWDAENALREEREVEARLDPIGLHEARHTFASVLIAAGVNARAITAYMGHSSITVTFDRYGHLMPGSEDEARQLVDAYLDRADTRRRLAALDSLDADALGE